MNFLRTEFLGNTVIDYINSIVIIGVAFIIFALLRAFVVKGLEKKAEVAKGWLYKFLSQSIGKVILPAFILSAIYFAVSCLAIHKSLFKGVYVAYVIILTFLSIRFIIFVLDYIFVHYWLKDTDDEAELHGLKSVMPVVKAVVYGIGLFFLLDNLGFKISTLLAGLGIGGVAVALAGQTILKDLFSYFSILFDKPFKLGDFITVDEFSGSVEHIGIKTTRLRSLGGEQLIFSNTDLTDSRVRNYQRMEKRRVVFKIAITYQTDENLIKEIPGIVKKIIEDEKGASFDRAHFSSYGDFSINFEIVYYVLDRDYNKYMDIQQAINFKIFEEFKRRGVKFAYPTQTLFIHT
jgi:small-conductance mechanosensitive channel